MDFKKIAQFNISFGGTGLNDKAILAKNLAVMQKSGLNIVDSLELLEESVRGRMKNIITNVKKSVESGNTLADSLGRFPKVFTGSFTSAIYAGEKSGTLSENLEHLSTQLQKEKELNEKVKGAMIYPIFVLSATFVLGMIVSFVVLPKITPLFQGLKIQLPLTTRMLISFSNLVTTHGVLLFTGIVSTIFLISWLISQKFSRPVTHWLNLNIPVVKQIVINSNLAKFSRTLGTLLKSGLAIDEALMVTKDTMNNIYYKKALEKIGERISKGVALSVALREYEKLFPKMVNKMTSVGENSGSLEDILIYLSDYYEVEVDNSTKALAVVIEPALLLFIGGIVAIFTLSIITPIYNITGNIRR